MDYSKHQFKILCEDKAHYHFVRGWLSAKGCSHGRVTYSGDFPHPGSGKYFVEKKFPYNADDPVALIVPKWSIDTWTRFLMHPDDPNAQDENQSCKSQYRDAQFAHLGKRLATMDLDNAPIPASLKSSYLRVKKQKEHCL
ncbi:MAG: hypothetical protein LBN33_00940 [Desulfovibrio sp.]|jgi:hypothetical protein|nr:hypothetical protein [Desulfovibrio sp.]